MERWWALVTMAAVLPVASSGVDKTERVPALYDGQFIIGALFAMHHQPASAHEHRCGKVWEIYGVQRTEVTFKTLDEINQNKTLLPNITLGAEIRDSCWYAPVSLQQTIELVRKYTTPYDPQSQCAEGGSGGGGGLGGGGGGTHMKRHLVGVLGPGPSSVSMQVQNLLQLFSVPQVGYSATSADLSKKDRFSTFFRMVPSDDYQARALIDLVRYHNWTYVSTINTDENYGQSGMTSFRKHVAEHGVCIAKESQILSTASEKPLLDQSSKTVSETSESSIEKSGAVKTIEPEYAEANTEFDELVERIRPRRRAGAAAAGAAGAAAGGAGEPRAHVVVCFCEGRTVRRLLAAIQRKRMAGELLLIGSDGWANRNDIAKNYEKEALGSLTLRIHSPHVRGFDDYYLRLNPFNNTRDIWFKEMWEEEFNCTASGNTSLNRRNCTGFETFRNYSQEPKMNFVVRGIYAMAYALHNMQRALCPGVDGVCKAMEHFNVTRYRSFLQNVSFRAEDGDLVQFDKNGDPPQSNSVYDIMNYQRDGAGSYKYVQVGSWVGGKLNLEGPIYYSGAGSVTTDPTKVESVCSRPCKAGYIKSGEGEKRCCWTCSKCLGETIQFNDTSCIPCENGTYANKNKTSCIASPLEYIKWTDTVAIVTMSFACIGFLSTAFTAAIFIKYNHTPVVKSSTRELSYLILFGIFMSHASVFTILAKPSVETCTLSRILPGISFALIYASVFTKTHRIARILAGSKKIFLTRKPRFMSATAQVAISLGLTLAAGSVCCYCLATEPPAPETLHPARVRSVLACRAPPRAVLLPLAPALALLAVRTLALPQNSNVAISLGLTLAAGSVCCYCLATEPPAPETLHPARVRSVLACRAPPRAVLLPLAPALALLAACAVLAVRTRALPQNFNEAKFIGVATYTTCVIWIAFFPTYFGSDSKPITLCVCVTLSATVTLVFLFFPRLYIVLLHPERNNRAHFITSKSIRCHIGRVSDARGKHPEAQEILGMEFRRAELRSISCQTELAQLGPPYHDTLDGLYPAQYRSPDWAELDPKPFLEHYKFDDQIHCNANGSACKDSPVNSHPLPLPSDAETHTRIREETVSECSLTDDDSMTQIKDITITLGLSSALKNRGMQCCREGGRENEEQQNGKKYF